MKGSFSLSFLCAPPTDWLSPSEWSSQNPLNCNSVPIIYAEMYINNCLIQKYTINPGFCAVIILQCPLHKFPWDIWLLSLSLFPIRQNDSAAKAGLLLTDVPHAAGCNGSQCTNVGCRRWSSFGTKSNIFAHWSTNGSVHQISIVMKLFIKENAVL